MLFICVAWTVKIWNIQLRSFASAAQSFSNVRDWEKKETQILIETIMFHLKELESAYKEKRMNMIRLEYEAITTLLVL